MRIVSVLLLTVIMFTIFVLQFFLVDIGRNYPSMVGWISFANGDFLAFKNNYDRGIVYPVEIGMQRKEVEKAFRIREPEFRSLRGVIYHGNGRQDFTNDTEIFSARKNGLRVQYSIKYKEDNVESVELISRVFSL